MDEVPPLPLMRRLTHRGLTLGFSRESGRVTVRVTGELDAAGSGAVEAALRELEGYRDPVRGELETRSMSTAQMLGGGFDHRRGMIAA